MPSVPPAFSGTPVSLDADLRYVSNSRSGFSTATHSAHPDASGDQGGSNAEILLQSIMNRMETILSSSGRTSTRDRPRFVPSVGTSDTDSVTTVSAVSFDTTTGSVADWLMDDDARDVQPHDNGPFESVSHSVAEHYDSQNDFSNTLDEHAPRNEYFYNELWLDGYSGPDGMPATDALFDCTYPTNAHFSSLADRALEGSVLPASVTPQRRVRLLERENRTLRSKYMQARREGSRFISQMTLSIAELEKKLDKARAAEHRWCEEYIEAWDRLEKSEATVTSLKQQIRRFERGGGIGLATGSGRFDFDRPASASLVHDYIGGFQTSFPGADGTDSVDIFPFDERDFRH